MRLAGTLLAFLVLTACGQSSTFAGHPTGTPSAPATSATDASPSPTQASNLNFSCRLPFIRDLGADHRQAGFLDLPSGRFTAAAGAPPSAGYYDLAVSAWVPVGRASVAPNGLHYAYMTGGNPSTTPGPPRLHIVDAATRSDRIIVLTLPAQQPYGVVDYAADGVYIASGWEGVTFGIWRVNPTSGTLTDVSKQEHYIDDGTGHAWVSIFDSRDSDPARSAMDGQPLPNEVARRDLASGRLTVWFYHPGSNVAFDAAFIGGGIVVWVETPKGAHEYWLLASPGDARMIAQIDGGGASMADSHGIWQGASNGLYLFGPTGTVVRVSDLSGDPANGCLTK